MWQKLFLCFSLFTSASYSQTVLFSEGFEENRLDPHYWTSNVNGGGSVSIVTSGAQGLHSVKLRGTKWATLDLKLDLSGTHQAELSFAYRDYGDEGSDKAGIWLSDDDGVHFSKVFSFHPERWSECWGYLPPMDLDEMAEKAGLSLTSRFVVRFHQESINSAGMGIDDLRVVRPLPPDYETLPFYEDFEAPLANCWRWRLPFPDDHAATSPCAWAGPTSDAIFGARSLLLGKVIDGETNTNAYDLHLNLKGYDRVVLKFRIAAIDEDEQTEDGLWFSDDGGEHFVKAYSFNETMWDMDKGWGGWLPPIEVGRIAKNLGLQLNDRFVIRFEQKDDRSSWGFFWQEGIWLDDISVTAPPISYVKPPFMDGFENGRLNAMWAWRDPRPTAGWVRNSGFVQVLDDYRGVPISRSGTYGVLFSKEVHSGSFYTANALDLHLDLAEFTDVVLKFWLRDLGGDSADTEDAIYLSVDDGVSFVKIMQIDEITLQGNGFSEVIVPISELAQERELSLTDRCVLRIQQADQYSPVELWSRTGFVLDDVSLTGAITTTTKRPVAVIPWVVDNQNFTSLVSIFNDGLTTASVELIAIDRAGNTRTRQETLAARALFAMPAAQLFPGLTGYALTLHANAQAVFPSILTYEKPGLSPAQTEAHFIDRLKSGLLFSYLPGREHAAIALVTPEVNQGATLVTLELYGTDGGLLHSTRITLTANRPFASLLSDLFPQIPEHASLRAIAPPGIRLAGTAFIFNEYGQPSSSNPYPR